MLVSTSVAIVITGLIDKTIRPALFFVRLRATPSRLLRVLEINLSLSQLKSRIFSGLTTQMQTR
ncbi:hypothetical protein NIES4073_31840 [Kalymmatonema gypsitolerans NIES-4073]|nr:hypothetical protein NIES4073_31840 [Scytonema sp. NIES-4073]